MDLRPIHHPEATSSSSASTVHPSLPDTYSATTSETKPIRSSARVKAAKHKAQLSTQVKDPESPNPAQEPGTSSTHPSESISTRNTRVSPIKGVRSCESNTGKGKAKEVPQESSSRSSKRQRRNPTSATAPLTINEPVRDPKGKKRAAPETDDEEVAGPSSKRTKTSAYSLRSTSSSAHTLEMPRKSRTSTSKGKAALKSKMAVASSSRIESEDVEMVDAEYTNPKQDDTSDVEEPLEEKAGADADADAERKQGDDPKEGDTEAPEEGAKDEDDDDDDDDDDEEAGQGDEGRVSSTGAGPIPGGMDEATALAIFGDYRQFGSYMMSLSSRLKTMLNNIKPTADPTTRLLTLQELSELLSISTEDTLAGSFQVEQFVKELVKILGGRGADEDEDEDEDPAERDEDAALAAALAMSSGGTYQGDDNLEAQVLACRCLANLMEALPGVAHTVVYHGAIPVLCSKLIEISYIDLAEQTLSTMEKISEEFPSSIVREGGLAALLNYLDFFSIAVQRTALQAASNCCRNVSPEHFPMIRGVWPIIRNCLAYSDQRLVEYACLSVIRVVDSYHRSSIENLESLMDTDLIRAVNQLLLPAGGSPLVASNTYTLLLRALATSARASAKITVTLLEADIVDTLYQILTGVLPSASASHSDQGDAAGGQGLGGGLADMTVMENLAHRPKEQVEEALGLISELLPPLPKEGVFDHKAYTEKSLARMVKAKAKADRAAARLHAQGQANGVVPPMAPSPTVISGPPTDNASPAAGSVDIPSQESEENAEASAALPSFEATPDRTDMLRSKPVVVGRFMQLLVPILVDVYAASVITPVRIKTLTGLLKAVSFLDPDGLKPVLMFVPVASFASSVLSSKDHPSLVIGALQLVDLLLGKLPSLYKPTFHREGVFHEIETLAERALTTSKVKEKEPSEASEDGPSANPPAIIPGFKKLSSTSLDPEDAITLRARVIQFKFLADKEDVGEDGAFENLRSVVEKISAPDSSDQEYSQALSELADLFASPHTSVSSFELLQSGVVDSLLMFATDENRAVSLQRRKEILLDAFSSRKIKNLNPNQTPFATLVKKLQESFTRMESFEVITVAQNSDESKRSSPSLLARQLRLRLVAGDDSDIPRNLHNIVVSIHAIATFQALHDYLRPRVAGLLGSGSRLSGMFAALAASGLVGSTSKPPGADDLPAPPSSNAPAESSSAASASSPVVQRRRSQRLAKQVAASSSADNLTTGMEEGDASTSGIPSLSETSGPSSSEPPLNPTVAAEPAPSDTVVDSELHADFTDDEEVDAEVFEDDVDPDNSVSEKTITLSVVEDGSKVEAQTPEGTRVATPNAAKDGLLAMARNSLSSRGSYAAALKAKPTDWHLEFSMDDHILPLDLTIYGAIHQHEMRKKTGATPLGMIWQGVYTIKFKKVPGPAPGPEARADSSDAANKNRSPSPTLSSLPDDAPHAKILRLLRVLSHLNTFEAERVAFPGDKRNLHDSAFVNNKLTAKLTRQLEEPMIVASSCLPDWALDLPQHFPFLFPFATRYNFLQSTSFGYARLILKWQSQQTRGQDTSRRDDGIGFLGRLQRQKVRISRKHILESAVKVFELYGSSSSILEVEYFEEVGTGLGPTLEFYSLVSKEFARKDLKLWRDADASGPGVYVDHPNGLYPAPISREDILNDGGQKRTHILRVIGQFVAKAMLDSRIIDLAFNKIFLKLVLGEDVPLTVATLRLVDVELANSLAKVQSLVSTNGSPKDKIAQKVAKIERVNIEDLALDFTLPGYDIELRPNGRDIPVTSENVNEYVAEVLDAILGKGAAIQAKAFRDGFSKVFPIADLRAFSSDELVMLFGNSEEDWSTETLSEALKADHGFNVESRAIRDLVEIMSEYEPPTRRAYLQFITGSPKLPIGGFRGLNPPLTVVRKPHEAPLTADDYLPSVMTCVNYLKLPEYSSKHVMKEKLQTAMLEGVGSFHLS